MLLIKRIEEDEWRMLAELWNSFRHAFPNYVKHCYSTMSFLSGILLEMYVCYHLAVEWLKADLREQLMAKGNTFFDKENGAYTFFICYNCSVWFAYLIFSINSVIPIWPLFVPLKEERRRMGVWSRIQYSHSRAVRVEYTTFVSSIIK